MKKSIIKFCKYVITPLEGEDGKLSGKRIIGTMFAIVAVYVGIYGLKHSIEHLDSIAMLCGTFLGASFLFWGITAYSNFKAMEFNNKEGKKED